MGNGEHYGGEDIAVGLVVTWAIRRNSLDTAEETFDDVARCIDLAIKRTRIEAIGFGRDRSSPSGPGDMVETGVGVTGLVGR